jgi:hypothetical protein
MTKSFIAGIAAAVMVAAVPGTASAVATGATSAADTVQQLQSSGYHVILNKTGDKALEMCHVLSVRPGHPVTETVPAGGGDTVQKVVYTPVYVDVDC